MQRIVFKWVYGSRRTFSHYFDSNKCTEKILGTREVLQNEEYIKLPYELDRNGKCSSEKQEYIIDYFSLK